jgi:hypothetical protein
MPTGAVCVTRPGKWGNPFKIGGWYRMGTGGNGMIYTHVLIVNKENCTGHTKIENAEMAVEWFRRYRKIYPLNEKELGEIRGKDLACFCPLGSPCHADVLLEIANQPLQNLESGE